MSVRIKVCGITSPDDARMAAALGAWAVGMIFVPSSPRFVTAKQARAVAGAVPAGVRRVGVFMNHSTEVIRRVREEVPMDIIQLHGRETNEDCRAIGAERVMKAVILRGEEDVERVLGYEAAWLLVDKAKESREEKPDWALAAALAARRPQTLLAGGLTPGNVAEALRAVKPWGLDVASGVESSPGVKDEAKMRAFFAAVHGEASS